MNDKLYSLYDDYNNIDKIYNLIFFLINKYDLYNYIYDIQICTDFNSNCTCSYDFEEKKLFINLKEILQSFSKKNYYRYRLENGSQEYKKRYVIYLLEMLLHEISHIMQSRELDKNKNDSIHKILEEQFEFKKDSKNENLYDFLYKYMPAERNANCNAKRLILGLNEEYKFLSNTYKSNMEYSYNRLLNSKYAFLSPLEKYYLLIGKHYMYKKFTFDEDYDIETIKSFGMPLVKKIK